MLAPILGGYTQDLLNVYVHAEPKKNEANAYIVGPNKSTDAWPGLSESRDQKVYTNPEANRFVMTKIYNMTSIDNRLACFTLNALGHTGPKDAQWKFYRFIQLPDRESTKATYPSPETTYPTVKELTPLFKYGTQPNPLEARPYINPITCQPNYTKENFVFDLLSEEHNVYVVYFNWP